MTVLTRRHFLVTTTLSSALLLAGCSGPPPATFDLSAPRTGGGVSARGGRTIVVPEPSTVSALDSERIVVRSARDELTYLPKAQWADRLPRLFQARLIQTFENRGRVAVGRPTDRLAGTYQMLVDIRAFEVRETMRDAFVEVAVKLVNAASGKVVSARLFSASSSVTTIDGAGASQALDASLSRVLTDITGWANGAG